MFDFGPSVWVHRWYLDDFNTYDFFSAYGNHPKYATPLYGIGGFFFDADERIHYAGVAFLHFVHQIGLCSFATSIPFGALHERVNVKAMLIFCSFNIFIFVLPAHWMWDDLGFLKNIGAVDAGGSGVVHLTGGFSGKRGCLIRAQGAYSSDTTTMKV